MTKHTINIPDNMRIGEAIYKVLFHEGIKQTEAPWELAANIVVNLSQIEDQDLLELLSKLLPQPK